MKFIKNLFDWKKHPIRILYILIPVVILKFGYLFAYSIAQITVNDYWFPLCVTILGLIILSVCVWPLFQIIRDSKAKNKIDEDNKKSENEQKN